MLPFFISDQPNQNENTKFNDYGLPFGNTLFRNFTKYHNQS